MSTSSMFICTNKKWKKLYVVYPKFLLYISYFLSPKAIHDCTDGLKMNYIEILNISGRILKILLWNCVSSLLSLHFSTFQSQEPLIKHKNRIVPLSSAVFKFFFVNRYIPASRIFYLLTLPAI